MKIQELQDLLGPAVLLPVARGEKKVILSDWQYFTLKKMEEAGYLASLNHGNNVAVLLGANSQG